MINVDNIDFSGTAAVALPAEKEDLYNRFSIKNYNNPIIKDRYNNQLRSIIAATPYTIIRYALFFTNYTECLEMSIANAVSAEEIRKRLDNVSKAQYERLTNPEKKYNADKWATNLETGAKEYREVCERILVRTKELVWNL